MIGKPVHVGIGSILDAPQRPLIRYSPSSSVQGESIYGKNVWIGAYCVIGTNVVFKDGVVLSDGSFVENNVVLGNDTLLTYRCLVCSNSVIGANCVIGGFVGENTRIGNSCRVFGYILHHHIDPTKDWDAPSSQEEGAILSDNVFIGFGVKITRPITISHNVYVCPNAIVSVDVPPFHVVKGVNELVPFELWPGELSRSKFFSKE